MLAPPTPPETTSTSLLYRIRLLDIPPPRALYNAYVPAKDLFRNILLARNAANAFNIMGTPILSRVYDNLVKPIRLSKI